MKVVKSVDEIWSKDIQYEAGENRYSKSVQI